MDDSERRADMPGEEAAARRGSRETGERANCMGEVLGFE